MSRYEYRYTRSGLAYLPVPEPVRPYVLPVRYYEPKPAWMDHIPGPWLRFGSRFARDAYLRRAGR
jgi:hypothetical protein